MLESGHTVADYQIVTPLIENPLFTSYQVTGAGVESAKLLLISVEQLVDKKSREAFLSQVKILLGQSFPGLCSLLAAETNDLQSYCLYPFPEGSPLAEQLEEQFSVRRSLEIIKQLAVHLSSAHAAGLWHGTVSPATIYLSGQKVSLDQFALASLLPLDFHSGVDPCYCSPELVRGEPLSTASDQYSLGIVLYRLLTGQVPFCADAPFATAMLHVQEQPAALPQPLALLQPLLDGLLKAVPGERLSAEQLVTEIDHFLQLAELESLTVPCEADPDSGSVTPDPAHETGEAEAAKFEEMMTSSDLTARIEKRLQERAEILQQSEPLTEDAKRASTERIAAVSRQSYRETKDMKYHQQQQKNGPGRLAILIAVGVAVGVIIYLTLFGGEIPSSQPAASLPDKLVAGLEAGSQQLERGDSRAAEKTFTRLLDDFALYPQPYNNLAAVYAQQGDLERARDVLERAMATEEAYAIVYRNLGTVYAEMARDSYGRALQLDKGQQPVSLQVFGGKELLVVSSAAGDSAPQTAKLEQGTTQQSSAAEEQVPAGEAAQTEQVLQKPAIEEAVGAVVAAAETLATTMVAEPQPVVEEILTVEPKSVEQALQGWAAAWSAQDIAAYLSFYATEFTPPAGNTREAWEKQRESRLTRPQSIEVSLSDFALIEQSKERLQIEATQRYRSDRYSDQTRKLFEMIQVGDSWKIVRERSLGRVR